MSDFVFRHAQQPMVKLYHSTHNHFDYLLGVDRRCQSIGSVTATDGRNVSFCFDPESPNAFKPPAYSLPRNPPSYIELLQKEYNNAVFSLENEGETSASATDQKRQSIISLYDILSVTGEPPPVYTADPHSQSRRQSTTPMLDNRRDSQCSRRRTSEEVDLGDGSTPANMRRRSNSVITPNLGDGSAPGSMRLRSNSVITPNLGDGSDPANMRLRSNSVITPNLNIDLPPLYW